MRPEIALVLWYSLMGIPTRVSPDEEELFQLLLAVDLMLRKLYAVNSSPETTFRSDADVDAISKFCFEVGQSATISLAASMVTTKSHRVMYLLTYHLFNYSCIPKGTTDQNETQHKELKKAYRGTNKYD